MTTRAPFRGTTLAGALLFDVRTIGAAEARRRVLTAWQPDSSLRALPDDNWLLMLPDPVSVRAELAPGLPLVKTGNGWRAPGLAGESESVTYPHAGEVVSIPLSATSEVDTHDWVDLSGLTVHHLKPLDRAPEIAQIPVSAIDTPPPDLRRTAGVASPSSDALTFRESLVAPGKWSRGDAPEEVVRARWIAGWLLAFAVALPIVIANADNPAYELKRLLFAAIAVVVVRLVIAGLRNPRLSKLTAAEAATAAGQPRGPGLLRELWSTLVWKSPARTVLNRKQQRYLEELTRKFEHREFDQALRDAIGLNGTAVHSLASLRLPRPRTSLAPGSTAGNTATEFGAFPTAFERLQHLYLEAARELEKSGRITEAAFVYADLLGDTRAAVDLLERHDQMRLAAELAQSQELEPALVIRLWWRAGERTRAVEVARSHGAFAVGIERLQAVNPQLAQEFRIAWVEYCREAGDPVAAVEAAWPDASLRSTVVPDIAAGMAMGGPRAAYLFAHLVTEYPTTGNVEKALALLDSDDLEARVRFTSALVSLRSTELAQDRRLATAALRSLLRYGSTADQPVRRAVAVLRDRCDPLVRADLPHLPARSSAPGTAVNVALEEEPGALRVYDAVALRGGAVLVAHGDHGVRLLTHDGRTRARWDMPVHQLVMADHGGNALLVTSTQSLQTIHRLDLATRSIRRWTTLPPWKLLPSYDGGTVTAIEEDGLAFIDTLSAQPKTLWRELDGRHHVVAINRTPEYLTALAIVEPSEINSETKLELLSWQLPTMTLRLRRALPPEELRDLRSGTATPAVLPRQAVVAFGNLTSYRQHSAPDIRDLPVQHLLTSGNALGILTTEGQLLVEVDGATSATVTCPTHPNLREHDGLLTLWTPDGQLAVVDPTGPSLLASFRTRH